MTGWRTQAACLGTDPDLFHPVSAHPAVLGKHLTVARRYCDRCPVTAECRQAREQLNASGIWAGEYWPDRVSGEQARAEAASFYTRGCREYHNRAVSHAAAE